MAAHPAERILAAELIATFVLEYAAKLYANRQNVGADPLGNLGVTPQQFLPLVGAYSLLGLVAMFGDQPARLAAGIGGLVALVVVLKAAGIIFPSPTTSSASSSSATTPPAPFAPPTPQGQGTLV